ncbi:MAG TPA: lysophospholipase [Pseudonocardiaceae bacterium]|nr:lysophospholipase [Pseudonocardiaceae bacterium]
MSNSHVEGHREIAPGRSTYWQAWLPSGRTRAIVVIVHGLHEHSARYAHVGTRLSGVGFAAYAADHRGHGRSDGRRANLERMALIVADLGAFVRFTAERHPDLPVFLVGHSLGGLIALQYATEPGTSLAGLVLSGPLVAVTTGSALLKRLAWVLSTLVPDLGVARVDAEKISRDPEVVRNYRQDPLVHCGKVKARTGAEILATTQSLPDRLPQLSMPLLLLHGTDDLICTPTGSTMVHDRVSSPDKTLRRYQDLYHEVFNEPERDEVLTDLVHWLEQHLSHAATRSAG